MTDTAHRNAKILIVDDVIANLRLLESILKQAGYTDYRSVSDSRQVVTAYQEYQPDLIVLDLMMPHLDGVAVMEQLQPFTAGTYLPVLVLTGDITPEAKRRALAAGGKDFLTKPLDIVEVRLRIRNLLETRWLYRQLQEQADRRIREQAALLDRANDAIQVRDLDGVIRYWNQGAERLYGWTAAEAVGRNAWELLYQGPPADEEAARRQLLAEGSWRGEWRYVTRAGCEVIVASRWTLVRDDEGRPQCRLILDTDITEKKKLKA